jgi:DNA-binding GntR family transcriptional regulator
LLTKADLFQNLLVTQRPLSIAILQEYSLTMLVQRELERMVLAGELAVGEKLNEFALASRLGVSRGPVREAVRALAETGLVRLEKNRGVFVREVCVVEVDEIYEVRAVFDRTAGRKLAASIQPEQLAKLRALVTRMDAAAGRDDHEAYHAANLRFHDSLVEFAGNSKLLQMYRRLVNELSLFRRQPCPGRAA